MPEKEGDEGKSTKSVVNKKQKQMMGEEGYDIARDMGRVKPSKDKKDATTMPVSDEVKKTQKVNKGPSAFERVKAKYGKSVMNVGKKKANEELDLTQVAEAFGGYIVEANGDKKQKPSEEELKKRAQERTQQQRQQQQRANSPLQPGMDDEEGQGVGFSPRQRKEVGTILKNIGKDPKGTAEKVKKEAETIKPTETEIKKQKRLVQRAERQVTSPKPGERQKEREIVKRFMDARKKTPQTQQDLARPVEPSFLDPKTDPFDTVPDKEKTFKGDRGVSVKSKIDRASRAADTLLDRIQTGRTKTGADAEKVAKGKLFIPRRRSARRYTMSPEKRAERISKIKSEIDKRNPTFTSPVTGGQLPVGGADDYSKRLEKAYFGGDKELPNPFALPAGSKKQTGITQTPRPISDPAATGVFSGKGVGRKDVVGTAKPVETGARSSVTANPRASREAQSGRDEKTGEILSRSERLKRFRASRGQEPKTSDLVTQKPAAEVPQTSKPSPNVSTSLNTKNLGQKFSEFGAKTQTAQQSTLGALGGFAVKQAVPASAAAEAGLRFAQGDTKGGILSGLQAMGGGLGFTAGVINAIRSMNPPKPRTDTGAITKVDPKKLLKKSAIVGGAVELARRARGKSIPAVKGGKAGFRSAGGYQAT